MKIKLLMGKAVFFLLLLCISQWSLVYAAPLNIIADGSYAMGKTDSQVAAEEEALWIAKRAALEQSGAFESSEQIRLLTREQLKYLTDTVMQVTVIDSTKTFSGNTLVFTVKIKAVIDDSAVSEAIKRAKGTVAMPAGNRTIGIVTAISKEKFTKDDTNIVYGAAQSCDQLDTEHKFTEKIGKAIEEKYGSRKFNMSPLEISLDDLASLKKGTMTEAARSDLAAKYKCDYLVIAILEPTKIENITEYMVLYSALTVKFETDCHVIICSPLKEVFNKTLPTKVSNRQLYSFSPPIVLFRGAVKEWHAKIVEALNLELPELAN